MVLNKITTWVVIAGAAEAKIYEHRRKKNFWKQSFQNFKGILIAVVATLNLKNLWFGV